MSGWQEVRSTAKDDWKSITAEFGEQSVMITLTPVMLPLSAIVLDSGLYYESVNAVTVLLTSFRERSFASVLSAETSCIISAWKPLATAYVHVDKCQRTLFGQCSDEGLRDLGVKGQRLNDVALRVHVSDVQCLFVINVKNCSLYTS